MNRRKRKDEPERYCAACGRRRKAHPVSGVRFDNTPAVLCQQFITIESLRGGK